MRDLSLLQSTQFNVCVIGAGVYGAACAQRLAKAGLKVVLIDKNDFCAATSANSLKILHGGLRYLQHGNLVRMRETIRARRDFMRFAPHLTSALACAIPTFGNALRSPWAALCATLLNNVISADRNLGLERGHGLPGGKVIGRDSVLKEFPGTPTEGVKGALLWYDALADNSERLALEYIWAARDLGAVVCNYLQADRLLVKDGAVTGVAVTDLPTGETFAIKASWVVNAAGPWFDDLLAASGIPARPTRWTKAVNLVVTRPLNRRFAVGIESDEEYSDQDAMLKRNKRFYFFVPWRGGTLIGTTYKEWTGPKDDLQPTKEDVREIVDEVRAIHPKWGLLPEDVTFAHAGLLPMTGTDASGAVQLAKHSLIIDHGKEGGPKGLLSLRSIKYTTAPVEADKVCERIVQECAPSAKTAPQAQQEIALPPDLAQYLVERYGKRAGRVAAYLEAEAQWLNKEPPLLKCEVLYFLREELAQTLSDVVFRRTGLASQQCPPQTLLRDIAATMAAELGWDAARQETEISQVQRRFAMLPREN